LNHVCMCLITSRNVAGSDVSWCWEAQSMAVTNDSYNLTLHISSFFFLYYFEGWEGRSLTFLSRWSSKENSQYFKTATVLSIALCSLTCYHFSSLRSFSFHASSH
jgi:hypothetical protein